MIDEAHASGYEPTERQPGLPPPLPRRPAEVAALASIPPGESQEGPAAIPPPLPSKRGDERRVAPRTELQADVSLYSETNFWAGFTEDISEGGLFVATYELLAIGTQTELVFELPTGHEVRTRAEVRWHRQTSGSETMPGMGLRFIDLSPEDHRVIQGFVKHRSPLLWDED